MALALKIYVEANKAYSLERVKNPLLKGSRGIRSE